MHQPACAWKVTQAFLPCRCLSLSIPAPAKVPNTDFALLKVTHVTCLLRFLFLKTFLSSGKESVRTCALCRREILMESAGAGRGPWTCSDRACGATSTLHWSKRELIRAGGIPLHSSHASHVLLRLLIQLGTGAREESWRWIILRLFLSQLSFLIQLHV